MVNDNKINDTKLLTHEATALFIQENVKYNAPPDLYDLDQEFANTKNNKNRITVIALIVFTVVFVSAAYFVTKYIEDQNSKIPISINAFEDVNLREIFDKAKQYEKEMSDAEREMTDIQLKKTEKVNKLKSDADSAIKLIETENPKTKVADINFIKTELEKNIVNETQYWENEILKVQDKINKVQEKIDSYDTRILEKAKEQESIINNQQKRFDMEMEKSVAYYEEKINELKSEHIEEIENINLNNNNIIETLIKKHNEFVQSLEDKYNPSFDETYDFLNREFQDADQFTISADDIYNTIYNEGLIEKDLITQKIENMYITEDVINRLKEIPYYNSPKQAINFIEEQYHESVNEYSRLISEVTPVLDSKNSLIAKQSNELGQLDYFVKRFVKENRVNGVIIDPRSKKLKVYIDPIYDVKSGTVGYVFRNDSDFIGTVKFSYDGSTLIAQMESLKSRDRNFAPFDMILLNLD